MNKQTDVYWGLTKKEFFAIIQAALTFSGNPNNEVGACYTTRQAGTRIARALLAEKAKREWKYPDCEIRGTHRGCANYKHTDFAYWNYARFIGQYRYAQTMID